MDAALTELVTKAESAFARTQREAAAELTAALRAAGESEGEIIKAVEAQRWSGVIEHAQLVDAIKRAASAKRSAAMDGIRKNLAPPVLEPASAPQQRAQLPAAICLLRKSEDINVAESPPVVGGEEMLVDILGKELCEQIFEWAQDHASHALAKTSEAIEHADTAVTVRRGDIVALATFATYSYAENWVQMKAAGKKRRELEARVAALEARPDIRHVGIWDSKQAYVENQIVTDDGSCWLALIKSSGCRPGTAPGIWRLIVKRGRDGRDTR
jgi:hypothetical protein